MLKFDPNEARLIAFITAFGNIKHSGRTLITHLLGTYRLLKPLSLREDVALAGGLHSIYGTNVFRGMDDKAPTRAEVQAQFGAYAERLIFLFSRINRPYCFETNIFFDRQTGEPLQLSPEEIHDLHLIEAANLLEQGESLTRFPTLKASFLNAGGHHANA